MKIFGIVLVKNENDIIEDCLTAASRWCDKIFVYDNGSNDDTWVTVNNLTRKYPQVIPFASNDKPFSEELRSEVFNRCRNLSKEGDWWCRLDADEFYIDNPRIFLESRCSKYHVVWAIHIQHYFTDRDLTVYKQNPGTYGKNNHITERLHYYKADASEPRFFRYRDRLKWDYGA